MMTWLQLRAICACIASRAEQYVRVIQRYTLDSYCRELIETHTHTHRYTYIHICLIATAMKCICNTYVNTHRHVSKLIPSAGKQHHVIHTYIPDSCCHQPQKHDHVTQTYIHTCLSHSGCHQSKQYDYLTSTYVHTNHHQPEERNHVTHTHTHTYLIATAISPNNTTMSVGDAVAECIDAEAHVSICLHECCACTKLYTQIPKRHEDSPCAVTSS